MLEGAHLRRRPRGRSELLIGDCWERRLLEHACPKGRLRSYAPEEPFAVACDTIMLTPSHPRGVPPT